MEQFHSTRRNLIGILPGLKREAIKGAGGTMVSKQGDSISVGYPVVTLARFYPFGLGKIKDMTNRKNHDHKTKIKNAIKSAKAKKRKTSRSKVEWSQAVCFDHVHRSLD
jgi:hypothetical protein